MSKTLSVTGMPFSNRNDNYKECLNTKTENLIKTFKHLLAFTIIRPAPIAQLVECPLRGTVGHGFDPGPRHTKVVKNGSSCFSLGTPTYGVELGLVDPVSG